MYPPAPPPTERRTSGGVALNVGAVIVGLILGVVLFLASVIFLVFAFLAVAFSS